MDLQDDPDFTPEKDAFLKALHQWLAAEMVTLYRQWGGVETRGQLLLGGTCWGQLYVDRFLAFTAPSLRAPANLAALKGRARVVLFTDAGSFDKLWGWAREMTAAGVPASLVLIPPHIVSQVEKAKGVFPLLGMTQNLQIQTAARNGMAYHSLITDQVYSSHYYKNLLRLSKKQPVIVQSAVSADVEPVERELAAYRRDDAIVIDAVTLGDMGWRNLHAQSRGNLMNRGATLLGLPSSFQCIYQGRDRLYLHCCHTNPVYLAPEICEAAPVRYFSPIDCNLPYFVGDQFYFPTVEDEMQFIEVSDAGKAGIETRVSDELHAAICWHHVKFRSIYLPWFAAPCEQAIKPQAEFMDGDAIKARHAEVCANVLSQKETVKGRIRFREKQAA